MTDAEIKEKTPVIAILFVCVSGDRIQATQRQLYMVQTSSRFRLFSSPATASELRNAKYPLFGLLTMKANYNPEQQINGGLGKIGAPS